MNEFEFIKNIKDKYGLERVGDDCAVLPKSENTDLLITADLLVEGVDFLLKWTRPEFIGHKALAVSLSDIAAMGGAPRSAMLSIAVPERLWTKEFLDPFYDGWHRLARELNVELVGGDISRTDDRFVIDSTVLGEVPKGQAVRRSGARPGDGIFVTSGLGAAAAGLHLLQNNIRPSGSDRPSYHSLLLEQLRPNPRTITGLRLRASDIPTAMIDLSDGLSSDLAHICEASGVGARLYSDQIPIHPHVTQIFNSPEKELEFALHGGEDLELLFTADLKKKSQDQLSGFFRIGEVTANYGVIELIHDGVATELPPKGYRHF